jgi:hypothetical protein
MPPQRKAGAIFFERRFLFSKDYWIGFQKDFRIFHLVFQRDVDLVFTDNWTFWIGLTQGYDLVFLSDSWISGLGFSLDFRIWFFFRTLDLGFSFGLWTRFFFGLLDLVFLWIVGPGFFFRTLDTLVLFA